MTHNNGKTQHMSALQQVGRSTRALLLNSSGLVRSATVLALGMSSVAHAGDLPTGGSVAAGAASIASDGTATTINQTTRTAVINWASFSVGSGNAVNFQVADSSGGTLNRVTGNTPSTIAGQITSNGAVYLVNPNGIAITSSGTVQTGGGFVASSLDISDADFMAGRVNFKGNGASKLVSNAGRISTGQGAYVALLGGAVANSGTITVPLGQLGLGSGEQIALDLNGGNFMQVGVPTALVSGSNALVENAGEIVVTGGAVQLQAAVLKDAVRNIINMSGSINADSAVGNGGTISLIGGADTTHMAGQVSISGSLSARATGANGNGGQIETSGAQITLTGAQVSTLAANGRAGTWLIDPVDFTIAATGGDMTGAALSAALAGGNVTILSSGGASGADGDITVGDGVSWSANSLTLDAYRNITVNAVMSATGTAGFVGITGDLAQDGNSTGGALNFGRDDSGFVGRLDLASTTSFMLNSAAYSIISSLGAAGSTTGTDLQGVNGNLSGNYVLGSDIDASATAGWSGGFVSIGTDGNSGPLNAGAGFTGRFDGAGHIISDLTIDRPTASFTGLFGIAGAGSTVSNVGLTNANVSGASQVGALAGFSNGSFSNVYSNGRVSGLYNDVGGLLGSGFGTIDDSYSTASVSGGTRVGGLAGSFNGQIANSHATGAVSMTGGYGSTNAGGLVGSGGGEITNSYATGTVTSEGSVVGGLVGGFNGNVQGSYASGDVSGDGGLVGGLMGSGGGQITNSHATGNVAGGGGSAGGLAGFHSGAIQGSYASGDVTTNHGSAVGGLVGHTAGSVDASYATGAVIGYDSVGGLVGLGGEASITDSHATGATGGYFFVGGLIGQARGGSISGSWASGAVRGSGIVGGLAGRSSAAITRSYATGNVIGVDSGKSGTAGGLVGENRGSLDETYATGSVTAENGGQFYTIGGLVGYNSFGGSINRSFASGNVSTGGGEVGGLVGQGGYASSITNSYATGDVSADGGYTGGLIGRNRGLIDTTYASGHVSGGYGGYYVGGLIGLNEDLGPINSYYDSQSTGQSSGIGAKHGGVADVAGSVEGRTTTQMMQAGTFAAWDIDSLGGQDMIWRIYEGYTRPLLKAFMTGANLATSSVPTNVVYNGLNQSSAVGGHSATLVSDGSAADDALIFGAMSSSCSGGDSSCTNVGTYDVSMNGGLYSIQLGYDLIVGATSAPLNITPTPLTLTFTANAAGSAYGSAVLLVSGSVGAAGLVNGDTLASFGTANWATTATSSSNAGRYSITGSGLANSNYAITNLQAAGNATAYTINPALLTLTYTANAAGSTYGSAVAPVSGSVGAAGLVNGDTLASFGTASWATAATSGSNAGRYSITGSGLANANYTITSQQAVGNATAYTINPALLTLTYTANAAGSTYGSAVAPVSGSVGAAGLVNGDTLASFSTASWATTATSGSNAGRYSITGSGLANSNYTITNLQASGNATAYAINPALLTLTYTANAAGSTYGSAVAPVSGAIIAAGLVNGDTLASFGSVNWVTTATTGSNVGRYSITGSGLANGNYTITSQQAAGNAMAYVINPALLTLLYTANAAGSTYGSAVSPVSGSVGAAGLVNGDTLASFGTASWVTTATSNSNAGLYGITGSGLANSNYAVTNLQAAGNATAYTINPALLTLTYTANAAELLFGQPFPVFTGSTSVSGLVNGDTLQSVLRGAPSWGTPATSISPAGRYAINGYGLTAGANYVLTSLQAAGNATALTITAADQAITAFQPGLAGAKQAAPFPQSEAAGGTSCSPSGITETNRRGETASLAESGWTCRQQPAGR